VDYKRPPRQRERKNDTLDTPELKTFDADLATDAEFRASLGARGSSAEASAGFLIGRRHALLRAHTSRRVSVKLTRRARRHLRRRGPLPAELKLTFRDPAGRRITESHKVTILPKRRG
jgi:hypothetical protein